MRRDQATKLKVVCPKGQGIYEASTGSLLFRVPNPMALCQNHCALRNDSFVSLQASLLKGIHLIQIAGARWIGNDF